MFTFFEKQREYLKSACDCRCQKQKLIQELEKLSKSEVDSVNRWERSIKVVTPRSPVTYYPADNPIAKIFFNTMACWIEEDDSSIHPLSLKTSKHRLQMVYQDMD